MLSEKFIINKIAEIQKSKEQLVANINALSGAEQAYREMLAEYEKQEVMDDEQPA